MSALLEIQQSFQDYLLSDGADFLEAIKDSPKESRDVLAGAYYNGYRLRLIEVLENDFPQLHAFMGDTAFAGLAEEYIVAHPSDNPNARWFARHMAAHLASNAPYDEMPILREVASFEWALGLVFDAADGPTLEATDLASVAPEDWPGLCFHVTQAHRRLDLHCNATEVWTALDAGAAPPPPCSLPEPAAWLIWRHDLTATFRALEADEAWAFDAMARGQTFADICEGLSRWHAGEQAAARAAGLLGQWLQMGVIAGITV